MSKSTIDNLNKINDKVNDILGTMYLELTNIPSGYIKHKNASVINQLKDGEIVIIYIYNPLSWTVNQIVYIYSFIMLFIDSYDSKSYRFISCFFNRQINQCTSKYNTFLQFILKDWKL